MRLRNAIYGIARDNTTGAIRGTALKSNVSVGTTVVLDNWFSEPTDNVSAQLIHPTPTMESPSIDMYAERKGVGYRLQATPGAPLVIEPSRLKIAFNFAANLAEPANGTGYRFIGNFLETTSSGSNTGVFHLRTQTSPRAPTFRTAELFPQVAITRVIAVDPTSNRPGIEWELEGQKADALKVDGLATILSWGQGTNYWLTFSPLDSCEGTDDCGLPLAGQADGAVHLAGRVRVPTLPTGFANFLPPVSGLIDGPIVFLTGRLGSKVTKRSRRIKTLSSSCWEAYR